MNVIDILKNIRQMKILVNSTFMKNSVRKYELQHVEDNLIDIDDDAGIV